MRACLRRLHHSPRSRGTIRMACHERAGAARERGASDSNGGGGGNRTRVPCFREMAATRDFRGQLDEGQGVRFQLVVPVSRQESPPVLPSRGEIVESGGNGVPSPAGAQAVASRGLSLAPRTSVRASSVAPTPSSPTSPGSGASSSSSPRLPSAARQRWHRNRPPPSPRLQPGHRSCRRRRFARPASISA